MLWVSFWVWRIEKTLQGYVWRLRWLRYDNDEVFCQKLLNKQNPQCCRSATSSSYLYKVWINFFGLTCAKVLKVILLENTNKLLKFLMSFTVAVVKTLEGLSHLSEINVLYSVLPLWKTDSEKMETSF